VRYEQGLYIPEDDILHSVFMSLVLVSVPSAGKRIRQTDNIRLLRRPRSRWIDNIKMDLFEKGLRGVDFISLAQNEYSWRALVNAAINLWVP
jgi:hypothetical protein